MLWYETYLEEIDTKNLFYIDFPKFNNISNFLNKLFKNYI